MDEADGSTTHSTDATEDPTTGKASVRRIDGAEIWRRLEASPGFPATSNNTTAAKPAAKPSEATPPRRIWRRLGILATVVWAYLLIRTLVIDIDLLVVDTINPAYVQILNYRVVIYLAIMATVALTYRRWGPYYLYVAAFPVIVLCWRIPRYLIRHRSWSLFLGLVQGFSVILGDLPYNVFTKSLAIIAAIFIVTTNERELLILSAGYIAMLYFWSIWRRGRQLFKTPSFVDIQRRAIKRVQDSKLVASTLTLGDEYLASEIDSYDASQANQVQLTIAYGIGLHKVLLLWAYRLEEYRTRKRPAIVFAALSYLWVFVAALLALTLLNTALLKLDPAQYAIDSQRPTIAIVTYTLSTFLLGSAGGMSPVGEIAYFLQLLGALTGILILAGGGLSVVTAYLRERDDQATAALVAEVEAEADRQEALFRAAYSLTPDEAYEKLRQLRATAASLVGFLVHAIPPNAPRPNRETRRHPERQQSQPQPYTRPKSERRRLPGGRQRKS